MMNTSWGAQVVGISSAFWLDTAEGRQYGGDATAYAENMPRPSFLRGVVAAASGCAGSRGHDVVILACAYCFGCEETAGCYPARLF